MEILYFPHSEKIFLVFSVIRKVIFFVFRRPKICFLVFRSERGCDGVEGMGQTRLDGQGGGLGQFCQYFTSAVLPQESPAMAPPLGLRSRSPIGFPSWLRPESKKWNLWPRWWSTWRGGCSWFACLVCFSKYLTSAVLPQEPLAITALLALRSRSQCWSWPGPRSPIGLPSWLRPESIGTQAKDRLAHEHPCKLMELNENQWNSRQAQEQILGIYRKALKMNEARWESL